MSSPSVSLFRRVIRVATFGTLDALIARPPRSPGPMRRSSAVALLLTFTLGCGESVAVAGPDTPAPQPPPSASPGLVTGIALDTQGRPIAGAKIWVRPALTTGLLQATTNANGRYEVQAYSTLPYYAYAWHTVTYRGKKVCLRLASQNAADYDSFVPTQGVVRNFKWQLSGEITSYDGQFFGGDLRLFVPFIPSGSKLVLTLVPDGALVDGSAGQTLTYEVTELLLQGIPVGAYTASAVVVASDGSRTPLEVSFDGSSTYGATTSLQWETKDSCVGSTGSGPDRAFLWIRVPGEE